MRYFSVIIFGMIMIVGCANKAIIPMPNPSTSNFSIWAVKFIDVSNGVELYEAKLIAKAYFVSGVSTCGFPGEPVKSNGKWVFPTYIANNRDPEKDIIIDEQSGDLQWSGKILTFEEMQKLEYVY